MNSKKERFYFFKVDGTYISVGQEEYTLTRDSFRCVKVFPDDSYEAEVRPGTKNFKPFKINSLEGPCQIVNINNNSWKTIYYSGVKNGQP